MKASTNNENCPVHNALRRAEFDSMEPLPETVEYLERFYRTWHKGKDLKYFQVKVKDSDLAIGVDKESYDRGLELQCRKALQSIRQELEDYIILDPLFQSSLVPVTLQPQAPEIARIMSDAATAVGVGPMAAVAGAFAEFIGQGLLEQAKQIVVENGGDIYMAGDRERVVAVFAGASPFSNKIGILVRPEEYPLGICTSSGTVGPSLSFGRADAAIIKAAATPLADAAATAIGNMVKTPDDFTAALEAARQIQNLKGVMLIKDDKMAVWGEIEIVPIKA